MRVGRKEEVELSLCMIVRNEEQNLTRCLESVKEAVDEIVILDTGSTDRTREIAAKYTDRIWEYAWQDDFAAARNASFAHASKPFVMWLDADDVVSAQDIGRLKALKEQLHGGVDAVMMPYYYAFAQDGRPSLIFDRERIVRREAGFVFEGAVHEAMAVSGHVIRAEIPIRHMGQHAEESCRRNLAIYERRLEKGMVMSARDTYYFARELMAAGAYERAEQTFLRFLQMDAWRENHIDAFISRGECLLRLGRRKEAKRAFLSALEADAPRAQALCALGGCFMEEGNLNAAALWYRAALLCGAPEDPCAFDVPEAYGYVPLMQLCVIYARMGDDAEAAKMNEQALLLRPGDGAALANRAYFAARLNAKKGRHELEKTGWGE